MLKHNQHPSRWNAAANALTRLAFAFIAVLITLAAGFGYKAIFEDEMDVRNPANIPPGILAPMYRHRIEWALIQWAVFASVIVVLYRFFGKPIGVQVNWTAVGLFLFRIHLASGILIVLGPLGAVVCGRAVQFRDATTAIVGFALLLFAAMERYKGLHDDPPQP
jgi:hypothetical protein